MPHPSEMERRSQWDADAIAQRNEQFRKMEASRNPIEEAKPLTGNKDMDAKYMYEEY